MSKAPNAAPMPIPAFAPVESPDDEDAAAEDVALDLAGLADGDEVADADALGSLSVCVPFTIHTPFPA